LKIFVTGAPGVGKTTVVRRTIEWLAQRGLRAGGLFCPELRSGGERVGFEVVDLMTGERGVLAHVDLTDGPRVGRYRVNLGDLSRIACKAIENAVRESDLIVIDEVGPMELKSEAFQRAVLAAVEGSKPVLGIIHWRAEHRVVEAIRRRKDALIIEVTPKNRDSLSGEIAKRILNRVTGVQR